MITNDVASDTLATLEDLENDVNIGLTTQQGEFGISDSEAATGNKIPIEPIEISRNDKAVLGRAEMMLRFLAVRQHLCGFSPKPHGAGRYEPGEQLNVFVLFIVGKKVSLTNFLFPQKIGEVFKQEVALVMKKMPKWSLGVRNRG